MPEILDDATRQLLDGRNFAVIASIGADGGPHSSVVWIDRDGDTLLFSVTADKQKARNLARDPRVSVSVFDLADPYHSAEIRGTVGLVDDLQKALAERLSQKYVGQSPPPEPELKRLVARITPTKVNTFSV